MSFEDELMEAVTTTTKKYPDIDCLDAYNALQRVSYSILIELEEQRGIERWEQIRGESNAYF